MTEASFIVFDAVGAETALAALAHAAPDLAALTAGDVQVALFDRGLCRFLVPDPARRGGSSRQRRSRKDALEALTAALDAAGATPKTRTEAIAVPADRHLTVTDAPAVLLLAAAERGTPDDLAAPPVDGEELLLADRPSQDAAATLLNALADHATRCRVTAADGPVYLIDVRDDAARLSTYQALIAAGLPDAVQQLVGHAAPGLVVYLPPDLTPSGGALLSFAQLVRAGPAPDDLDGGPDATRKLALVPRRTADGEALTAKVYPLSDAGRVDLLDLAPGKPLACRVEVEALGHSAAAAAWLRDAVAEHERDLGYRLELRPAPRPRTGIGELERIREQILELETRHAALTGLAEPAWTLMRFSHRQLPGLVDALTAFPPGDIDAGLIQYGFRATTGDEAGSHYLLFSPDITAMVEPFAEHRWRGADDAPIRYWVDPFWRSFYQDAATASLVMVPAGMALWPTLHSWEPEEIDALWRHAVGAGRDAGHGARKQAPPLPDRPIYLFDKAEAPDVDALVTVLDRDGFVPLVERIGWLNRNLEWLEAVDADADLAALGTAARRASLADRMAATADAAESRLADAAAAVERSVADRLTRLLEYLTEEVVATVRRAEAIGTEAERMHGDLARLEQTLADLAGAAGAARREVAGLLRLARSAERRRGQLTRTAKAMIADAEASAQQLDAEVTAAIGLVGSVRSRLLRRLDEG